MLPSLAVLLQDFSDLDEDTATGYQTGQLQLMFSYKARAMQLALSSACNWRTVTRAQCNFGKWPDFQSDCRRTLQNFCHVSEREDRPSPSALPPTALNSKESLLGSYILLAR